MTTSRKFEDSEGKFLEPKLDTRKCRECQKRGFVYCTIWNSNDGGYTDFKLECRNCGSTWWIDGPDS